jgi:hypothetical protein
MQEFSLLKTKVNPVATASGVSASCLTAAENNVESRISVHGSYFVSAHFEVLREVKPEIPAAIVQRSFYK